MYIQVRMDVPVGESRYTLVASQSKRSRDMNVTMQAWCTERFSITPLPLTAPHSVTTTGEWRPENGGQFSDKSPRFQLRVPAKSNAVIKLLCQPKVSSLVSLVGPDSKKEDSGAYRQAFSVVECALQPGVYTIVASTYAKLVEACAFALVVETDNCVISVSKI